MLTFIGDITIIFILGMVAGRAAKLRRQSVTAVQFGSLLPRGDG